MKRKVSESRLNGLFAALQADLSREGFCSTPASTRLGERMRKRAKLGERGLREKALASFLETNVSLKGFRHSLNSETLYHARSFITNALERFTRSLDGNYIQGTLKYPFLLDNWRFGPGASFETLDNHAVDKFEERWTCTAGAEPLVRILRVSNSYFQRFDALRGNDGVRRVRGSRLDTVPKNEDTERTIAIEPLGNMALQLAAGRYLEGALVKIGLDIREQQPKNKDLARVGSLDGSIATIDLKCASDMISTDVVQALLPPCWYTLLMNLRSPFICIKGVWHELYMISTMGNGFTFPLMTLLLASLVYANRVACGGPTNCWLDWSQTAVYGDDIIVPVSEYESLLVVLHEAGLIVNRSKSFSEGPFRESCGGDFHTGMDITPFYVKDLDTDASVYVTLNSVFSWSSRHKLLPRTIEFLRGLLSRVLLVPEYANPDAGLRTRDCPRRYRELRPKVKYIEHRSKADALMTIPLLAGGYLNTYREKLCFSPRLKKVRWELRKSRLPKGHLDGRCVSYCTAEESRDRSLFVAMFF